MRHTPIQEQTTLHCEAIDAEAAVIRGVKLLGLHSKNNRTYTEAALAEAIGLYEGAKVNVNHPKGHPLAPRDYAERLGVIKAVEHRAGDGLYGELHFNLKHTLAEQLLWDAQSQPTNVGLSHNVLAKTVMRDGKQIVESIVKVVSVDLVADPATTNSLYEAEEVVPPSDQLPTIPQLTLEQLSELRRDLVEQIRNPVAAQATEAVKTLIAAQLPYRAIDAHFLEQILTSDAETREQLIADRKSLIESLTTTPPAARANAPQSTPKPIPTPIDSSKEFAALITS